jgi:hypothetical protein
VEESTITSTPKWYTAKAKTKLHTQQRKNNNSSKEKQDNNEQKKTGSIIYSYNLGDSISIHRAKKDPSQLYRYTTSMTTS